MGKIDSEIIGHILSVARLAPSSHNTQPWQVKIDADKLTIGYDTKRVLVVADPNKRELFISLGCFIETIIKAAEDFNLKGSFKYIGTNPKTVGIINFQPKEYSKKWSKSIRLRRSDRRFYEDKPLTAYQSQQIETLKAGSAKIKLFDNSKDINFLAEMTHDATVEIMSNREFRTELSGWVRNNWTKQHDGMPGYTQGMPGPISLIAPLVIRKNKKIALDQAKKDAKRVAHSSSIGLICIDKETPDSWIDAGRLYQTVCLTALEHGVKTSAVSAAIINPSTVLKIKKTLPLIGEPITLLRFGFTINTPKEAPKRSVHHITSY